ncbi:hypothetical protein CKO45_09930 [Paracraurococcus ruber]|uniref:Uncharacterized protein n=1 Tax=Paracraurococcus ruber TaxID=77675 RepID=A0ABS1CXV3_9PROT|nr:hypothetical protein [Paracraurococcus ruber]
MTPALLARPLKGIAAMPCGRITWQTTAGGWPAIARQTPGSSTGSAAVRRPALDADRGSAGLRCPVCAGVPGIRPG